MREKVIVIGCPGSGKSTFARALGAVAEIPVYHLDLLNWNPDKTTVPKEVFRRRLHEVMQKDRWIIDGNYNSTMELRLQQCETVFFLDYPVDFALRGSSPASGRRERICLGWKQSRMRRFCSLWRRFGRKADRRSLRCGKPMRKRNGSRLFLGRKRTTICEKMQKNAANLLTNRVSRVKMQQMNNCSIVREGG